MDFQGFVFIKKTPFTFHSTKKNKVHSFKNILEVALFYFKLKYL